VTRNVLVVGMHRSGTSAATQLVSRLGLELCPAGELIGAGPGNETGYWESSRLTSLNEELLASLGGAWWRPPVLTGDRLAALVAGQGSRALRLFRQSYPGRPWVWKDPRNCVLLPFWRRLLDPEPVVVLTLRNLPEVCHSLRARNGFSPAWSLALCERYLSQALRALAGLPVVVTRYEQLTEDPASWIESTAAALASLGVTISRPPTADLMPLVRRDLRHSQHAEASTADLPLTPAQRWLADTLPGLSASYLSFPALPVPAESALTTATLRASRPDAGRPDAEPASAAERPAVTVVVEAGPAADLGRRALLAWAATAPAGSQVLLAGQGLGRLAADLHQLVDDVTVSACDPADLTDVVADDARRRGPGYLVFTTDLAHPHPNWAQSLGAAFADERVGAAGPLLRAWGQPEWSAAGLRVGDAALNGAWLPATPDAVRDVPLLCRHCLAVRRPVLAEVGGLDPALTRDGVWDWELCARIWRAGHRIVAVPEAGVTVRFAGAAPVPPAAFRRNLLRFAALHLGVDPLAQLLTGLDARSDPDLVLDVLAAQTPARRHWLRSALPRSGEEYARHLLPATTTPARAATPQA
jgi:hypothetical protein